MRGKPRILSLFPNSFYKFNNNEHSCKILYLKIQLLSLHAFDCLACFNVFRIEGVSIIQLCVGETTNIWPFLKYNVLRGPEGAE